MNIKSNSKYPPKSPQPYWNGETPLKRSTYHSPESFYFSYTMHVSFWVVLQPQGIQTLGRLTPPKVCFRLLLPRHRHMAWALLHHFRILVKDEDLWGTCQSLTGWVQNDRMHLKVSDSVCLRWCLLPTFLRSSVSSLTCSRGWESLYLEEVSKFDFFSLRL